MKPTKKDRKKFDIDLEYGIIREEKVADMLTNKKVEVKSERGMWIVTGKLFSIFFSGFHSNPSLS